MGNVVVVSTDYMNALFNRKLKTDILSRVRHLMHQHSTLELRSMERQAASSNQGYSHIGQKCHGKHDIKSKHDMIKILSRSFFYLGEKLQKSRVKR